MPQREPTRKLIGRKISTLTMLTSDCFPLGRSCFVLIMPFSFALRTPRTCFPHHGVSALHGPVERFPAFGLALWTQDDFLSVQRQLPFQFGPVQQRFRSR